MTGPDTASDVTPGSAPDPETLSPDPEMLRERVLASLITARERTTLLTSCVEEPDLTAQHSPLMS
ncbi:ergothioneine biosynthesis protein EgtB, partial [Streptomyces sp. NPDC003393]